MGAMFGFVIGYVLGTRAGEKGHTEIKEAWHTIRTSDETRDLISRGLAGAKYLGQNAPAMIMERLQLQPADRSTDGSSGALRPTG